MRRLIMRLVILLSVVLTLAGVAIAEGDHVDLVHKGNQAFESGDFKTALEYYHSAETCIPESPELEYNMGSALHEQGAYEEAIERLTKALSTTDIMQESRTHYNLGNTHFRADDFQKAIESYQKALEINPDDRDAKYNLELARRRLKDQMEEQEQDQQEQQQQEQQEQDQQQKPDDQEQQDQEQQQEDQQQQQQDQQDEQSEEEQQPQPQEPEDLSKEDAERILNALQDDEQEIQKQVKRRKARGNYVGKDW